VTPLESEIRGMIALEGPIPLERYTALCLGHPQHGYYMVKNPLGGRGDFITAPEISQMFGELIGLWAATVWQNMGEPASVMLVELGPGRGTMMTDMLRATQVLPGFHSALSVHMVETSPVLSALQQESLKTASVPVTWHSSLETLPDGPVIVIANEFFDALPIRQLESNGRTWHERMVGVGGNEALIVSLNPDPVPNMNLQARAGDVLEVAFVGLSVLDTLARRVASSGGAALIIDYGHARTAFGDTLQAVKNHSFVPPLQSPGEADLTAHVDFAAFARQSRAAGAMAHGPITQSAFLTRLGLRERAEKLKNANADDAARRGIDADVARLAGTAEAQMGKLFKVLALCARNLPTPPGFEISDPLIEG
jgi:NADH dehydrogenase [ubiquinone] 1 alpha subcomplex assembly factor 7